MTETTTPVEEQASSIQAGDLTARLQACREKAGLDIEQAADEMHLSANLLRALEREDFAHLPEPPYVRGYLRGYAKLADVDAKDLIRTYEALRGANPDEIAHHFAPARPLGKVTQPSISSGTVKFIGLSIAILGLGLLSMIPGVRQWATDTWASFSAQTAPPQVVRPAPALDTFAAQKDAEEKSASTDKPADSTTQAATDKPATDASAAPATDASKPASDTGSTASASTPADTGTAAPSIAANNTNTPADSADTDKPATATDTTATPAATTADKPVTDTSTTLSVQTDATKPVTETAAATPATTPDAATTPATTTATDATATPAATGTDTSTTADASAATPAPIAGEVNIKLEFTEEVWMQVKDDSKKSLFEALNSAGSTKEFKAKTPLDFKVGNARGVKIYLNGQEYNQTPHIKGSVARFKVE